MQPVDQELTFEGHPDQARPLEASELFGIRVQGGVEPIGEGYRFRLDDARKGEGKGDSE